MEHCHAACELGKTLLELLAVVVAGGLGYLGLDLGNAGDYGYNARADRYENLMATGVIDPAKVTRVALENAASIAGMFLTTQGVAGSSPVHTARGERRMRNAYNLFLRWSNFSAIAGSIFTSDAIRSSGTAGSPGEYGG